MGIAWLYVSPCFLLTGLKTMKNKTNVGDDQGSLGALTVHTCKMMLSSLYFHVFMCLKKIFLWRKFQSQPAVAQESLLVFLGDPMGCTGAGDRARVGHMQGKYITPLYISLDLMF